MIALYSKYENRRVSRHLNLSEIRCKCTYAHCRHTIVVDVTMNSFERLRMLCGDVPLYVLSGHRCSQHNYNVEGVALSQHILGLALDIKKPKRMKWKQFISLCEQAGFSVVIAYFEQGFAHCDNRGAI